jgi:C-terminal processing protease CtpA/Prc
MFFVFRTGAIHVGDRLLAINGDTTRGKTLTEATNILQYAGDLVTLKIARPAETSSKHYALLVICFIVYRELFCKSE